MNLDRKTVEKGLFEEFAGQLATVFETMAGTRPAVACEEGDVPANEPGSLCWRQPLHPVSGSAYVVAAQEHWVKAGKHILAAAGIDDAAEGDIKSTYLETIGQALGGLAAHLTSRLGREVSSAGGEEVTEASSWSAGAAWTSLRIGGGSRPMVISLGLDAAVAEALLTRSDPPAMAPIPEEAEPRAPVSETDAKTFDLLLDVELPVSVSFGRAHVPLKDVLKLTTGSIVELNRAVVEPVDIIVNNCVIARGEVVVVEGNFGVRIQQVVSRSERLRTLQ